VLLGMQRTDMIAFLWDAEHVTALKRTEPVTGIRAGGALTGQFGIVWLRFEAAETFAFAPTITDVGFRTDVALPWNPGGIGTYFTAGLDMSYRYGNRSFFEGRAQMRELQGIVTIGVAVGSPLKRDVD
jgi:hypothetical protein